MPKMFGATFPLPLLNEKISWGTGITSVAAGATDYIYSLDQVGEAHGAIGNRTAIEGDVVANYLVTRSGILRNLFAYTGGAPGAGETYTYTVRVNGVNTTLTCQTAGAVAIFSTDLINSVEVNVGDRVTVQVILSVGAVASRHVCSFMMSSPSLRVPYEHCTFSGSTSTIAAGLTRFIGQGFRGGASLGSMTSAEANLTLGYLCVRKGTLKNLVALAGGAAGAGESFVYTVRVNGVNTLLTITISGAAQTTGMDTTNIVPVNAGDRVTLQIVTSAAAAAVTHATSLDFEEGDYRAG